MAADPLRAVARHEADHERARHRDEHHEGSEVVAGGGDERGGGALEEEEVREEADELEQGQGDVGGHDPDEHGQAGQGDDAAAGREVAERARSLVVAEAVPESGEEAGWGHISYYDTIWRWPRASPSA